VKKKFVIVGNSAAGIGALESIRKHDRESSVTVISDEDYPTYSRCLLSYFLAGKIDETGLRFRPDDFYKKMGAEVILGQRVESVEPEKQRIVCQDDTRMDYDQLLIATGGTPKVPANISSEISGIFVLRTVADAIGIQNRIKPRGYAVVLGGGLVGMKVAFALNHRGMHVSVVVRSPHVLSQMVDSQAAQIVMSRLREYGIDVFTGSDITEIENRNGEVLGVHIDQGSKSSGPQKAPCDILVVAKGVAPNMGLVEDTPVERNLAIVTNARMQTTSEKIYAAGDVAETFDIAAEQRTVNALWTCAVQQGKIAGLNMIGEARKYDGSVGMNSINFPGVDLISFGVIRPQDGEGYEVLVDSRPEIGVYKKLVLKDDRIKGLILVNRIDHAGILLSLLGRKVSIADLKDELLDDRFSYAKVLARGGHEEMLKYWSAGCAIRRK
jgi:NAD(P)H-nitrite reductase large subunit